MYRFAIALLLGLSVIPAFADDVTCNSLGPAIAMQRGLNLPLTDRVTLVQACQTGVQMREDGVSVVVLIDLFGKESRIMRNSLLICGSL